MISPPPRFRAARPLKRVFTSTPSEVSRNSTRTLMQAAAAVNVPELRNGRRRTQRFQDIPGCHKIQRRKQCSCSIHRMARDGADWAVSNSAERICPARRTVKHGLAPAQEGEDLLGSHTIVGTELIFQSVLLYGTIDYLPIVDTNHSLVLR